MKPMQQEKKQRMIECAMRLFMEKGIEETSVNDIVREAHLAKGTFYVYFNDKAELIHEIMIQKNYDTMQELIQLADEDRKHNGISWPCAFLKQLITFYTEHPKVLKLIHHTLFVDEKRPVPIHMLQQNLIGFEEFLESFRHEGDTQKDTINRFLIILEMSVSVCYNAIFFAQPDTIERIAPLFYTSMCDSFMSQNGGKL